MKFYIASRLENVEDVRFVRDGLIERGHEITYDWTIAGPVRHDAEQMKKVSLDETNGVLDSEIFLLMLPGGRGAHVELGLALSVSSQSVCPAENEGLACPNARFRIPFVWSPPHLSDMLGLGEKTSAFYHHPAVHRTSVDLTDLAKYICTILRLESR